MSKSTKRVTRGLICILFLSVVMTGSVSAAYRTGTILTKAGDEYKAVVYSIDNYYRLVKVVQGEKSKNISFKDIQAIYDENGDNIAGKLLKGYYKPIDMSAAAVNDSATVPMADSTLDSMPLSPTDSIPDSLPVVATDDTLTVQAPELQPAAPQAAPAPAVEPKETWLSQTDPAYVEARQARWAAEFILSPTFTVPAGDYYDLVKSGIGFRGGIRIAATHNIAIRFDFLRSGLHWDDILDGTYTQQGSTATLTEDWSMTVYRFMFSGEYYLISKKNETTLDMLYFGTGLGSTTHSLKVDRTYIDESNNVTSWTDKASEAKFTLMLRAGGNLMLTNKVGVDLCLTLHQLFIGKTSDAFTLYGDNIQYAYNFDFSAGLVIAL